MTFNVTQEHIDRGTRGNCSLCPIALSIIQTLRCKDVAVAPDGIDIYFHNGEAPSFALPNGCAAFMDRFDGCETVKPFSFELPL